MDSLRQYIDSLPGRQGELARRLGITPGFVSQWISGVRPIPIQQAIAIERETAGVVTVEELRPDIDWSVIRGKPAAKEAA
jgi:DNA-binding transcriptional regulator YdaS (Cro superfamily)